MLHLRQRNLVAQYLLLLDSLKKKKETPLIEILVPGGKIVLSVDKRIFSDLITVFHQL